MTAEQDKQNGLDDLELKDLEEELKERGLWLPCKNGFLVRGGLTFLKGDEENRQEEAL